MKHLILSLFIALCVPSMFAKSNSNDNDTLRVESTKECKLIEDAMTNAKGQKTTKYYIIYDGELIPTTKRVAETMRLCKKHGAKCALAVVISKKNKHKRIILN